MEVLSGVCRRERHLPGSVSKLAVFYSIRFRHIVWLEMHAAYWALRKYLDLFPSSICAGANQAEVVLKKRPASAAFPVRLSQQEESLKRGFPVLEESSTVPSSGVRETGRQVFEVSHVFMEAADGVGETGKQGFEEFSPELFPLQAEESVSIRFPAVEDAAAPLEQRLADGRMIYAESEASAARLDDRLGESASARFPGAEETAARLDQRLSERQTVCEEMENPVSALLRVQEEESVSVRFPGVKDADTPLGQRLADGRMIYEKMKSPASALMGTSASECLRKSRLISGWNGKFISQGNGKSLWEIFRMKVV